VIEHVVLLAVRPGADAEPMLTALRELAETIPGIVSLSAGTNITERGKQFTHGLSLRLESRAALDRYIAHPRHVAVVEEQIKPIIDDIVVLDWDVTD
jgi:hypothetical protein